MKRYRNLLIIAALGLLPVLANAGSAEFIAKSLDLDISKVGFGTTNSESLEILSADYHSRHPERQVKFQFTDGKLTAAVVSINGVDWVDQAKHAQLRAAIEAVVGEYHKLERKQRDGHWLRGDEKFEISFNPLCSLLDLFGADFSIQPAAK